LLVPPNHRGGSAIQSKNPAVSSRLTSFLIVA
jgi:hypothetical protein